MHYRHGLAGPELAAALGVSHTNANTKVGRLRDRAERALGAILVARRARHSCPELTGQLTGWDGQLTPLVRKRIARHIDHCPPCQANRARLTDPRALLSSLPMVLPAPLGPREAVLAHSTPLLPGSPAATAAAAAAGSGPAGVSWWPYASSSGRFGSVTAAHLAIAAPVAAAVLAAPILAVALLSNDTGAAATSEVSAQPALATPGTGTSPRFSIDMPTTHYAATSPQTTQPTKRATPNAPRGGAAPLIPGAAPAPVRPDAPLGGTAIPTRPRRPDPSVSVSRLPDYSIDPAPAEPTITSAPVTPPP